MVTRPPPRDLEVADVLLSLRLTGVDGRGSLSLRAGGRFEVRLWPHSGRFKILREGTTQKEGQGALT